MCSCDLLKMVTLCYSEAILPTYKITRCHNSDNSVSHSHTLTPIMPGKALTRCDADCITLADINCIYGIYHET